MRIIPRVVILTSCASLMLAVPAAPAMPAAPAAGTTAAAAPLAPAQQLPARAPAVAPTEHSSSAAGPVPKPPDAIAVLRSTPGGGLTVSQIPASQPRSRATVLEGQTNIVATSPVRMRRVLALPASDGSALDLQWPLNAVQAPDAWPASTGAGITVAVVDTGVDTSHPDLAGSFVTGYNAMSGEAGTVTDNNGHGTHVAGIIAGHGAVAGVAPAARIMPIRVMDSAGYGTTYKIITGVIWAVNNGADIINVSVGSEDSDPAERAAIEWARAKGVLVIAAAGNTGTRKPIYPAAYGDYASDAPAVSDSVIGVGAVDRAGSRGFFSQRGEFVDVAAPGVRVLSTFPTSRGSYAWESGTSMSAPFVTGIAALALAYQRKVRPEQSRPDAALAVDQAIRSSARDLGPSGNDPYFGRGEVSAAATLVALGAAVWPAIPTDLGLLGRNKGKANLVFTAPAGSSVEARLTSAEGSNGAPGAATAAAGVSVWSGVGGKQVVRVIPGLSPSRSYAVTLFMTSNAQVSRAVTGLRSVKWSLLPPRSIRAGVGGTVRVATTLPGLGIVPIAPLTISYKSSGRSGTTRVTPMSSAPSKFSIPRSNQTIRFRASIGAGVGFWPSVSAARSVNIRN